MGVYGEYWMKMSAVDVGALIAVSEHGGGSGISAIVMYIHLLYTQSPGPCSDAVEQESVEQDSVE